MYAIIEYCQNDNIIPVLITTPFSQYYNELVSDEFLQEFYATVHKISSDTGVSYYDYSHDERFQYTLEYFSDSDHLSDAGKQYFMGVLQDEVTEVQEALR